MESEHKQLTVLRCKCVVVGDACTGKTALTQVFNSGGNTYPKNYVMVRSFPPISDHIYRLTDLYVTSTLLNIYIECCKDDWRGVFCQANANSEYKCGR